MLRNQLRPAILLTLLLCVITGFIYPGIVTGLAQILFPHQANGSLVVGAGGRVLGSSLIGQSFSRPEYFHPRPSAAGAGYDDTLSAGTNLGPTSAKLDTMVATAADSAVKQEGAVRGQIPSDMVTASGSGLDPHISPANALLQVGRVARVRGADAAAVRALVAQHVEGRQLGVLGEARVNVLMLNLALDKQFPMHAVASATAR
jgi:K+-transporting ATPase ATPase C chain